MRKLLLILLVVVLLFIPTAVSAGCPRDCLSSGGNITYRVSYFNNSEWVTEIVTVNTTCLWARPSVAAAELIGLKAGYNCFVSRVFVKR